MFYGSYSSTVLVKNEGKNFICDEDDIVQFWYVDRKQQMGSRQLLCVLTKYSIPQLHTEVILYIIIIPVIFPNTYILLILILSSPIWKLMPKEQWSSENKNDTFSSYGEKFTMVLLLYTATINNT